ncbi:TPA: hypothetical protein ACRNVW_001866 [Pseudomonas aeruginosa]
MSNELTDVRCPCGAEFQADSYDAGFIAGSGMCQNCDAALPPKDICTCPSGNGSLRHPCPAHPAVEQAGGDERDFQAEGAQEVPSPVSQEYDRHLISLLRKGEALPGHQEEAADEIERLRDWNDHLNNTVLPNILNPTFLMLMKGGERLLDLCTKDGEFIGVSLNDMKDVFDWMVTHARIAPDQAALAQPSPKCATCNDSGQIVVSGPHYQGEFQPPEYETEPCDMCAQPSPAQAEQAEAERPEVVAWQYRVTAGPQTGWSLWHPGKGEEFERSYTVERRPLMTVAQHERIVGELRAVIAQLRQHKNDYMDSGQQTYRALQNEIREREAEIARLDGLVSGRTAERDAALARVAELESKLSDTQPYKQHPQIVGYARKKELAPLLDPSQPDGSYIYIGLDHPACWAEEPPYEFLAPLYTGPVAQYSVPDGYRLIRLEHFAAIKAQLNPEQVDAYRGRNIYDEDKVYANWNECRSALDEIKDVFQQIDWDAENELAELLAAAPGKEGL